MDSQRELPGLTLTHKASSCLSQALKQHRISSKSLLTSAGREVLNRNKTTTAMADFVDKRDNHEKLQGIIRGLSNYQTSSKNLEIESMIDRQIDNRRSRHLNALKDFEAWHEKLVENIKFSSEESKKNWENFANASNTELESMIQSFTEEKLLKLDLEYVMAGFDNIQLHANRRLAEADKMKTELYRLQNDKLQSTEGFLALLKKKLVDIAFQLPPNIDTFISLKKAEMKMQDKSATQVLEEYTRDVCQAERKIKENFVEKLRLKEEFWRTVHHRSTLEKFSKEINSKKFVNPEERVNLFLDLKQKQREIFDQRVEVLNSIVNLETLSQAKIETQIEKLNTLNDFAQETYDTKIQQLVNFQKKLDQESEELLEVFINKLHHHKAKLEESLEDLIQREGRQVVDRLKNSGKLLLTNSIKYLEETDLRTHEVCQTTCSFFKSIGKEFDELSSLSKEEEKHFDLTLASRGDAMDDTIDELEESFKQEINKLKRSITLEQLESRLQEAFKALDKIATERRLYTEEVTNILKGHSGLIKSTFQLSLFKIGEKFGLMPLAKKEKYLQDLKEKKIKELEESKPLDEPKRRFPRKDEDLKIELPVLEDWSHKSTDWFVLSKIDSIASGFLVTEEDRERQKKIKLVEEERKKAEEEKRIAEEAQRKEETRKSRRPEPRKIEEPKAEIKNIIQEPIKIEEPELIEPIDPDGNVCVETDTLITLPLLTDLSSTLLKRSIDLIFALQDTQLSFSQSNDEKLIEKLIKELDEHLRFIWPRKGKLEVNEYSARLVEIKRHSTRWDRHSEDLQKKKIGHISAYVALCQNLKDSVTNYKLQQDDLKKQLQSCLNLAECQGLMRKSKDLELQMFQHSQDLLSQARELYNVHCVRIVSQNSEFISSLSLIEQGGNYDKEEVDYYREKTLLIDREVIDLRQKWSAEFESLIKKTDQDRAEPIKTFEKEYLNAVENISARDGTGKKYGAARRTAQERIRAEMTKCEKAQAGIDKTIDKLQGLLNEYRGVVSEKLEAELFSRSPQLSIDLRVTLISIRTCSFKYALHISAFKEDIPNLRPLTWKENIMSTNPAPDEAPLEQTRLETMLDPLEDIGVQKNPVTFWQRVLDIEKNAREESLKLFTGKPTVPEFMEKYLKNMKSSAEDFRLKRVKALRESSIRLFELTEIIADAVISSLWYSDEFNFEQEWEKADSKLLIEYQKLEDLKQENNKLLRPNLSNPSCRKDLEDLNKQEEARSANCKTLLNTSLDGFYKTVRVLAEGFKVKLLNNSEILLYIYDNLFSYDSFIPLPGDQLKEVKRSHIKKLITKKKTGKNDLSHIHRKTWPGLPLSQLRLPQDPTTGDSASITSIKTFGHKAVIKYRNECFKNFCLLFDTKTDEFIQKIGALVKEETKWNEKWEKSVSLLKTKNT